MRRTTMTTESQDATPTIEERAKRTSAYLSTLKNDIEAGNATETAKKPTKKVGTKKLPKDIGDIMARAGGGGMQADIDAIMARKAKKSTKKPTIEKEAPTPAVDRTSEAGDTILGLVKKAGKAEGASTVATLAAKMAKGSITHAQLVSLRDAIKTLSQALRDDNKAALAKQLANANRAVRRLERATRRGGR
jgi:hypothetical protein